VTGDTGIADLASLLLYRIGRAFPLAPGAVAAETRSRAAADVMRCALLSPSRARSETLANRIAEALAEAVTVAPGDTGAVIDAVIAPTVMAAWGGKVALRLITHAGVIAAAHADLAARIMKSVWEFDEHRDEKSPIGNSGILGLTSTRKQDLDLARYQTGQTFPAFLQAAPDAAFHFLTSVISLQVRSYEPVRAGGRLPRVYQGQSLQYPGHRALLGMTRAVITFLITAAESDDAQDFRDSRAADPHRGGAGQPPPVLEPPARGRSGSSRLSRPDAPTPAGRQRPAGPLHDHGTGSEADCRPVCVPATRKARRA